MSPRPPLFVFALACLVFPASAAAECKWDDSLNKYVGCSDSERQALERQPASGELGDAAAQALSQGASRFSVSAEKEQAHAHGHVADAHGEDASAKDTAAGEHKTYKREQALEKIREQFDAMEQAAKGKRLRLIQETRSSFERQLNAIPGNEFSIDEVSAIDKMYRAQMGFSRELRQLERSGLPAEVLAQKTKELEAVHERKMNEIHVHAGDSSLLISALHKSIKDAVDVVFPPGSKPAGPGDEVPTGRLPGRHGDYMQDKFPKDPTVSELSAREKLAAGDKAGGLSLLNQSIANGGTADAYALRGGLRLEANDFDGAYRDAKKALELNPGDKNAMGILRSAEGRATPGASSSSAGGGSGAGGSGGGAHASHAGSGFATGGFDPGRARDIPGMTPASTLSSNQKLDEARRAMAMGDLQAAIALAQRALELNPSNAAAHGFLSAVYARMRDYPRAIASASAGLALSPRDPALLNGKAFAENRAKLYRDALGSANGAIEADSRNAYSYANRAYAYGGLADREAMMADIRRAAGIDPRFEKAAAEAAELQLPSSADILFMFPGEAPEVPAAAPAARSRSFGLVVGAGILGGLLLALGLLSTVLAPVKDSVVSAFTKATRRGPSVHALEEEFTPEAAAAGAAGLIRGQYEISRQIGAGGMGMVYEGTDRSLGRRVAIKKMREELRVNAR
ncbi:MAG: tetratricopeptide repeat protein, partial [Elusimicrobiota bacterium]|nr:tetratricopeptide repeat protein [Elusimicrobiota bacterium]